LNIVTTSREDHQVEMLVEVDADRMEAAKRRAARKISEKAKIPGFRPGKAPYEIVLRNFGEAAIVEEAIEFLVAEIYPLALDQEKIVPGGMGQIESIELPKFKFLVPLQPSVELGDYRQVRFPYEWQAPAESELEEEIKNLRRMYASTETVEREIEAEDYVLLDLNGHKAKAAEGEEPLIERKGFAIVIRAEARDDEFPFSGFAQNLIGLKAGESKSFSHKYPKNFSDEKLSGQNVVFDVTIKTVRAVNMPELDDDFAKKTGLGETVAELREHMQENMESESRDKYDDDFFSAVIDKIMEGALIKYPPQVVAHEAEHVMQDLKDRLGQQGMDIETYLKVRETTEEKFLEEEATPVAKKRLERSLLLDELALAEKIQLDDQEVLNEVQQIWSDLLRYDDDFAKRTKNGTKLPKDVRDGIVVEAAHRLSIRKVLEQIKLIATGQAAELPVAEADEKPVKKAKKAKSEEGQAQAEEKPARKTKKAQAEEGQSEAALEKKPAKKATKAQAESAPEAEGQSETPAEEKPAKKKSSKKAE
jgi:trigger factor